MNISPTQHSERIVSLDILRGVAILGILIMNIQSMSMIGAAYLNPHAYGDFTGINKIIWIVSHIFADTKFITIFSILFGAGIILFTDRLKAKGVKSLNLHYRRTIWLLIIGLGHAYLLWYGDILVAYALCALWVVLLRNKKPKTLFIVGVIFIIVSLFFNILTGLALPSMDEAARQGIMQSWLPSSELITREINTYRGGFADQIGMRMQTAIWMQTFLFFFSIGWKVSGIMLIGMGLYKTGVLSAGKTNKFYRKLTIISLLIGFSIIGLGLYQHFRHEFSMEFSFFLGSQYNSFGSLFVALGYIGLIMLILKSFKKGILFNSLKAIGQTALSNYLIQTIICTFLFYGHGFGLFGKVERWQQILIVFGIWVLQMIVSPIWVKYYKFGPFEWLWRSLTYWKFQEFNRVKN